MRRKTGWKEYREDGSTYRIQAEYGFDWHQGNSAPYFGVTGTIDRKAGNGRWVDDRGGCIHDEVTRHFPELREAIPFHLMSTDEPMHYLANGWYWIEKASGRSQWKDESWDPNPEEAFASTVVYGMHPDDPDTFPGFECSPVQFARWAEWRLASVKDSLIEMAERLGCRIPTEPDA